MMERPHTSTLPRLLKMPAFVRYGIRIDSAAAWRWLALLAVALWPTWWWLGRRMVDGTDDPLGAVALAALVATLWHHRARLRAAPRLGFQIGALTGAVLTTALYHQAPDGLLGLIGVASLAAGLIAFLPAHVATAPVLGLSALALPLMASLPAYVGQTLRVVTAEASSWALSATHTVVRSGATLLVDGSPVTLDAAFSGLHLAWLGLFTACATTLVAARSNRAFIVRLPIVGVLLLLGNILRNTVLVALQTSGAPASHGLQTAMGLLVLATVCGGIAAIMRATPHHCGHRAP